MWWEADVLIEKTAKISGRIFWSFVGLFFLGSGIGMFILPHNVKWLELIAATLVLTSLPLLAITWAMPGIFVLLGAPWLAYAWFSGLNSFWFPPIPWDQMSTRAQVSTYLYSIILLALLIFEIVIIIQPGPL